MSIPAEVLALLEPLTKLYEGCKLTAYKDPGGVWTIGYGHTGLGVVPGLQWTQQQADAQLAIDLADRYSQLIQVSPRLATASSGKQAALADFVYNLGIGAYQHSTLRSAVDCFAWQVVKTKLTEWIHDNGKVLPGLVKRRQAEINLIDL